MSLFRLDGKVAVVIGAGSGIGAAVARGAAEMGASVVALDALNLKGTIAGQPI